MFRSTSSTNGDPPFTILVDVTRCSGCERCVAACGETHGFDPRRVAADRATTPDGLSAHRLCTVAPLADGHYARRSCMHCDEPSCVAACLVGGISKTAEGPVIYDPDKCIGCRYCMLACPYHIPRYEWEQSFPFMKKCDMCWPRLQEGGQPACVEACPNQALSFGLRDAIMDEIDERMRRHSGRYLETVWGSSDWGGGSVLYISDVDLAPLGFGNQAAGQSIPSRTDPLIHHTPHIGLSVAASLSAVAWVIARRDRRAKEAQDAQRTAARAQEDDNA